MAQGSKPLKANPNAKKKASGSGAKAQPKKGGECGK